MPLEFCQAHRRFLQAARAIKVDEAEAEKLVQSEVQADNSADPSLQSQQSPAGRRPSKTGQAAVPALALQLSVAASEGLPSTDRVMPNGAAETAVSRNLAAANVEIMVPDAAKLAQSLEWLRIRFQKVNAQQA